MLYLLTIAHIKTCRMLSTEDSTRQNMQCLTLWGNTLASTKDKLACLVEDMLWYLTHFQKKKDEVYNNIVKIWTVSHKHSGENSLGIFMSHARITHFISTDADCCWLTFGRESSHWPGYRVEWSVLCTCKELYFLCSLLKYLFSLGHH